MTHAGGHAGFFGTGFHARQREGVFFRVADRGICQLLEVSCTLALAYVCVWNDLLFVSVNLVSSYLARLVMRKV